MSELREAAQTVGAWAVECDGDLVGVYLTETAAKLVAENMHEANRGRDFVWRVVPLVRRTHPPRDEWRLASEPPEDGRDVVVWCAQERRAVHGMYVRRHPPVVGLVDGWVAPDASKLTHWRDVTPPTESPIAAKCQRIEGSGEICGLTPPCPDCGSSLIDVAEGSL
jgi:hypothetical protein